ncbi:probable protein S-acyltransferase 6 isoform X3 [Malania oleifera]|uniref:probable protein S-acyltransferase 6 isoform X3 n=1 Tax=Malania oleifera TaxID=397392 RepID=UPI0025AEB462|nr:probable protein S-acyltransferase 6 isoform X3 [Malania oleifera]
MLGFDFHMNRKVSSELLGRCMISCFFVIITHFTLSMILRFSAPSSLLTLLPLSALVLLVVAGFGRFCRRLLGVSASASAFVFFNMLFIWGVYIAVVRQAISPLMNIVVNGELVMLLTGLCSIISSDPGVVKDETSHTDKLVGGSVSEVEAQCEELEPSAGGILHEDLAEESTISRVRYCRSCKAYIKGFDHHCPAFGNCIGQKNHVLFMVLLVGFVITETSYVVCCFQFATQARVFDKTGLESGLSGNLSISTMLFSLLQVLWQVVFLAWHIYCVCVNIKTEEWINWKNYPEFQLSIQPQPGQTFTEMRFRNPYNKGVLRNLKEFLVSTRAGVKVK